MTHILVKNKLSQALMHLSSGYERFSFVVETNCISQPENQLPWYISNLVQFILQPQYTNNPEKIL